MIASERASVAAPMRRPIPRLEGGLPVLGHALSFGSAPLALLEQAHRRYGPVFALRMAGRDFVCYAGPAAQAAFFDAGAEHLSEREAWQLTLPASGRGLACATAAAADDDGAKLVEARLEGCVEVMHDELARHLESWGESGELALFEVCAELALGVAVRGLFGDALRARVDGGFAAHLRELQGGPAALELLAPRLPTPQQRRRERARRELVRLLRAAAAPEQRGDDALEGSLAALLGAWHSASVLAAWTGIELLRHPHYLPPIQAELAQVYATGGDRISQATLASQVRLDDAVKECERLHPPVVMVVRRVVRDFEFDGFVARAGSMAMVSPALSHRLAAVFEDPHRFDPERFAASGSADALIGRGGARDGLHFAYALAKATWSVLFSRYELALATLPPGPDFTASVTGPHHPCRVRYRRREKPLAEAL